MKRCSTCKDNKEFEEFYRNGSNKDGYSGICKSCLKQKPYYSKKRTVDQRRYHRKWYMRTKYGITPEEYDRMHEEQGGVCGACGKPEAQIHNMSGQLRMLCVDHSHSDGRVRGLLCANCNIVLGYVGEDAERLINLAQYISRTNIPALAEHLT